MKLTLEKKILAGFIICSVILATVAVISFKNSEKVIISNQWVSHTHEVLYQLDQILVACVDAETGERGYIITGEENYLEPYNSGKSRIADLLAKVKELTADNPTQQVNIANIHQQVDLLTGHLDECIQARKTAGFEKAREMVATGRGKSLLDDIRRKIDNAKAVEQTLLAERKQVSEEDARNFNLIFIILLAIIVLVLVVVYFIISGNLRALKKAEMETAQKNWTLTGSGELIKEMQGNRAPGELAQAIINYLAGWLDAQAGALYIAEEDNGHLKLAGAFALDKLKKERAMIRIGEGLAGQAAAERRTILVTDIPAGHFIISTSFGEMLPEHILAVPVIFEGALVAVIELGSIHGFTALQQQYLQVVMDNIAIAITSSLARERTRELLEETQRQAEELEAQQEELKQTNEELHEKTELLEKSEAELKTQQEELQQTNEELEEKANLLEDQKERLELAKMEVETKARELETTSKFKSEFLANMSHELRTPLNSILILAQLLTENKSRSLGDKEVGYAKNIHSSGTDLLNLINEILDLSKVESGKIELEITEVNLSDIAESLRSMFNEIANAKSIDFTIVYPIEKITHPIHTDHQRLEQILRNLLSNAFKFTGKGGSVTLDIDITAEVVAFSVIDTGIGIPESKQGIIFQAFQQADGSTKRKYGGTGLGLSISRELAHALGGEISLQSEAGKGSRFTFSFPVKFDPSGAGQPAKPAKVIEIKKPAEGHAKRLKKQANSGDLTEAAVDDRYLIQENDRIILIIEDDESFARILLDFFRERNYKGIMAHQGNTGLSLARYYRPDAIVLDMQLPVMDGSEVLRQLKNDPDLRHIPVQIFSGYDRRKESLELGAFDFIKKPVTQTDMHDAVDRMEDFIRKKLKKLLIVEDNRQQNEAIRELIGNGDVKAFSAYAGGDAFEIMKKEKFDCIIIDLGLPDMSGIDLLEKIKGSDDLNKIPVIVYTGKDLNKDEAARLNKLANTVVLKTANSKERLLDEVILFLHRVESNLPKEKQQIIRKLHRTDEVLKNRKVLIVDDDMRNIYSLTNALEEEGLRCITAENGKTAIGLLKEHPDTDIVLMDVMMPEMDGYEATSEIRKMKKFGKLPIIALTAKAMKGDREKCLEAGMSDYVAKPVNIEQLLSLMRVWLYR
ncbi:response regulator [Puia dinghuensis]|uniref:histidine kinase n=1 Tax=Puia dinghuensis TaxID=1792502 RepID=A0A8J2XQJ3_9BACT|nr:response regulator [Puia dinghuensis]GGA85286.1 histidine kinase [Puia dinghuensis]